MTKNQYETLLKRIRDIYPEFKVDEVEWWEQLKDYSYDDVSRNLQHHSGIAAPICSQLKKGLKREVIEKDWNIQCELCKKWIHYTTWDDFELHHRRCSKIDFIDRQAKELKGEGIDYSKYYLMSDEELDTRYRKIMDNWKASHDISMETLFKPL